MDQESEQLMLLLSIKYGFKIAVGDRTFEEYKGFCQAYVIDSKGCILYLIDPVTYSGGFMVGIGWTTIEALKDLEIKLNDSKDLLNAYK